MQTSTARRFHLGHLPLDPVTMSGAVDEIERLVAAGEGGCVFTPNVDHIVVADSNEPFRAAYRRASLSLVDGMPVVWGARFLGEPVPEKVSGSDILLPLMKRAGERG